MLWILRLEHGTGFASKDVFFGCSSYSNWNESPQNVPHL